MLHFSTLLLYGFLSVVLSSPAINLDKHFFSGDESDWDSLTERTPDEAVTPDLKVTSRPDLEVTSMDWSTEGPATFSQTDFLEAELSVQLNPDETTTVTPQPVLTTPPSPYIRGVLISTFRPFYGIQIN